MAIGIAEFDALVRRHIAGARVRCCAGPADNLTTLVESADKTYNSAQTTDVLHLAFVPEEGIECWKPGTGIWRGVGVGNTRDLAAFVDAPRPSVRASQRAEVLHTVVLVQKECARLGPAQDAEDHKVINGVRV